MSTAMPEDPEQSRWPRFSRDAVPGAIGGTAGAIVGSWTKDPYIGAAIAPFITTGARFVSTYEELWWERVGAVFFYAQQERPDLILDEPPTEDLARMELSARVVRAAGGTPMGEKIRALGRVLAQGLDPGGRVDDALLLAAALDEMEAPHAKLLRALDDAGQQAESQAPGWSTDEVLAAMPELQDTVVSVLRTLERHDLIRRNSATWPGGQGWDYVGPFAVTRLGRICLDLLRESGAAVVGRD